jgi:hypothetical protein
MPTYEVVDITPSLVLLRNAYRIRADALEMKGAGGCSSLASLWPRPCTALFARTADPPSRQAATEVPGSNEYDQHLDQCGWSRLFVDNYKHGTGGFVTVVNMAMPLPWSFTM